MSYHSLPLPKSLSRSLGAPLALEGALRSPQSPLHPSSPRLSTLGGRMLSRIVSDGPSDSSLFTNAAASPQKATEFARHNLALVKPHWLSLLHSSFSVCPLSSQEDLLHHFARRRSDTHWPCSLSFAPFLKTGVVLCWNPGS